MDTSSKRVQIDKTTVESIKQFPAGSSMLVWQTKGIIYALGGITTNTNQLVAAANSI